MGFFTASDLRARVALLEQALDKVGIDAKGINAETDLAALALPDPSAEATASLQAELASAQEAIEQQGAELSDANTNLENALGVLAGLLGRDTVLLHDLDDLKIEDEFAARVSKAAAQLVAETGVPAPLEATANPDPTQPGKQDLSHLKGLDRAVAANAQRHAV